MNAALPPRTAETLVQPLLDARVTAALAYRAQAWTPRHLAGDGSGLGTVRS